jgi:DNA-binding LytR/AlgR family response regulator
MNCIIVDDNLMARMAMRKLIEQVKDLSLVAECENAMVAYNIVNQKPVDVLFLDIEMPGMTGIELTKNLKKKSPFIIFTTAKPDYAVDAFELNVIDYLVKPIEPARFLKAVDHKGQRGPEKSQCRRYSIPGSDGRLCKNLYSAKVSHCPLNVKVDRRKITSLEIYAYTPELHCGAQ